MILENNLPQKSETQNSFYHDDDKKKQFYVNCEI